MGAPIVDVVIPTFNRVHYVCRAIESVLAQTYRDCLAIVVDDGSTDETAAVIRSRYAGNDRVAFHSRPNRGVSAARNYAIGLARGDYIAFLDSDDVWKPWKVDLQLKCFRAIPSVGMIWSNMDAVNDDGAVVEPVCMRTSYDAYSWFSDEQIFQHSSHLGDLVALDESSPHASVRVLWGDVFPCMAMGNLCQPSSVMLTRERIATTGGFDESMATGEDHKFHLNAARAGDCALLDVAAISYRKGGGDQLTRPELQLQIAKNFLLTIKPVIESESARLRLPPKVVRARLAAAHAWVAGEAVEHGDNRTARSHLWRSLQANPAQLREILLLLAVSVPPQVTSFARRTYRMTKGWWSRSQHARRSS